MPGSTVNSFASPPETDGTIQRKRPETFAFLSGIALVLAIPGPLLVLIVYILNWLSIQDDSLLLIFLVGFYSGLFLNAFALVIGLCSMPRWKGLVAVCISIAWWCFVYREIAYGDWSI